MTTARKSNEAPVLVDELLSGQPPVQGCAHARVQIRERVAASGGFVLVLDDDPTGSQAVHDVPLLTAWDEQSLDWALGLGTPMVFVLTTHGAWPPPTSTPSSARSSRRLSRPRSGRSDLTPSHVVGTPRCEATSRWRPTLSPRCWPPAADRLTGCSSSLPISRRDE